MQSMATVISMRRGAKRPLLRSIGRADPGSVRSLAPGGALLAPGLDDLLAAVVTARADVMTQMHFARRRLDRKRRVGEEIVSAVHAALRRRFFVLLDCHMLPPSNSVHGGVHAGLMQRHHRKSKNNLA